MVDDINFDGVFSTGIIKATSWGSAIRQEMEKVRNSTKALREEWLALINESIDTSTTLGSQNYNALRNWNIASEDGSDVAEVYNESSDALKEYLDTCSSGKATWEGFVAHQKEAAAGLQSMAVGAKAAAVGMKILKAAMNMAVMMVAQWVIQKIVEGIDNLIHEQEKLHEAAEEARKQYEETVSELEAWEEALSNVKAQLAALESISTPTLADQAQTEELRKQNAELAFQVEYLKQKAEIEKQEKDENEDKEWNNFKNGGFKEELLAALHCGMQSSSKIKIEYEASDFSKYADYLRDVENLKAAEEEYNEIVSKGYSEASEARRKELEEDISTYKANILSVTSSIEESENEEAQALIKQRTYLLADAAGKAALLKATLNDIAISDNAVEVVERIATTISDDGTPNVMEFEVALHKAIPNDEDYNSFVDLAGGVDAVIAAFGTLPSVVDDSYAGALDEMRDFADLGSLFNNEETEDNIKSSITDLIDTAGEDFSIKFNETFGGLSDSVQNVLSSILSTDDLDTSGIYDFFSSIGKISEKFVADGEESMKRYQKASDDITSAFGKTIEGVSGNIGTIGELSAAMSAVKTTYDDLTAAMDEQNSAGEVSLSTYLSLIEQNSKYAEVLEIDETGAIHLVTDAREQMVMGQIEAIKNSIQEEIELKRNQIAMYKFKGTLSVLCSAILDSGVKPSIKFTAILNILKQAMKDIVSGNFSKIDFANTLESEVNKMLKSAGVESEYTNDYAAQIKALETEAANLEKYQKNLDRIQSATDFNTRYNTPSTSSSSSSSDAKLNAWKELLAQKKHQLEMEQITEEEYYSWLEANYKKQLNDAKKYADEWREYEETLYKWKKQKRLDDWNDAVDAKKHELEMDKIDETEYYEWLARNYKSFLSGSYAEYIEERKKVEEDLYNFEKEKAEDAQEAVEDLIDLRIDMLKKEKENEKDNLKERQDNIKDFYDEQRDLLKEHYDKIDKEKERREKRKAVTDIQAELLELEADDSVEAQKRRLELEEELSEAKEDLDDFERDEELEQAEKMYDDLEEMQVEYYDKQIEYIEDYLDNAYELRQQAIQDLQDGNAQLYQEMIEYNRLYGSGIDSEITSKWDAAYEALNRYNKLLDDTYGIKLENMTGNTSKTYIPYDKLPEDKTSSALNAAQKVSSTSKGNTSSGTSTTTKKAAPAVGSKVTVKTTATNFSPKSNSVKMNKSVPGSTYIVYQTSGNQVLIGLSGNRYTGWVYQSDLKGYASGTSKASGGLSVVDENGFEYILGNPSKGRYQFLNNGDKVFNSKASDFLYNWANQPAEMLSSMMKSLTTTSPVSIASPCNISVGDINISGNADEKTVVELRKARKELVTEILTEFKKMKK